jgi:ABC-type multidrug transport system fused ATPase/permease subunit
LLFFFYAGLLQAATSSLAGLLSGAPPELVGLRNLANFFATEVEEDDCSVNGSRIERSEPIEVSNLSFSYNGNRQLYNDADLHVPARAVTVIHGPSGSGKSTLIQLLLRFRAPDQGSITIGGIDITRFSRTELRRKIGVVTQDHYIFNETLRQNLLVAQPEATDQQIIDALHQALLSEFLDRLPKGLDTVLDPRGKGLSAGEKQRICIARMLLKKAPIMILDEPWSNLDDESRCKLSSLLNSAKKETTLLILSHEKPEAIDIDQHRCLNPDTGKFFPSNR